MPDRTVGACRIGGGQRLVVEIGFEDFQFSTKFCIHKTWQILLFRAGD